MGYKFIRTKLLNENIEEFIGVRIRYKFMLTKL